MIEVGTQVVANYGAMHPEEYGTVTYVHDDGLCNVMFDGGIFRTGITVRPAPTNGYPIGVYVDETATA